MTEQNIQGDSKRAHSVTRNEARGDGFSVDASPFNPVKLELGFMLLIGFFLLIIVHRFSEDGMTQITVLACYGLAAMGRLIYRTRQLLRAQLSNKEDSHGAF